MKKNDVDKNLIIIGVITDKHGIKGLVKVKWYTETISNLEAYNPITLSNKKQLNLKVKSKSKGVAICELENVNDANLAESLKGEKIYAKRTRFPILKKDEFYHVDLIGCEVKTLEEKKIGRVTAVHDFGAGPILEIGKELILFNDNNFPNVDIRKKIIFMNSHKEEEIKK